MGWWNANDNGGMFGEDDEKVWGDGPADILDEAIERIVKEFEEDWGRRPTLEELQAGFRFSTSIYVDMYLDKDNDWYKEEIK